MIALVLVAALLLAAIAAVVVRRSRRSGPAGPQLPDGPLDRDAAGGQADARGAVNRNSWMLGGGGSGG